MRFDRFLELVGLAILAFTALTQPLAQVKKALTLPSNSKKPLTSEGAKASLEGIMTDSFKCLRNCFIQYYRYQLETAQSSRLGEVPVEFGSKYFKEQIECAQKIEKLGAAIYSRKKILNDEDDSAVGEIKMSLEKLQMQLSYLFFSQNLGRGMPDETSTSLLKQLMQLWAKIMSFKIRNARSPAKLLVIRIEGVGYLNRKVELMALFAGTFAREEVSLEDLLKIAVKLTGFLSDLRFALRKLDLAKSSLDKICLEIDLEAKNGKQVIKLIQKLAKDPIVTFLTAVSQPNEHAAHANNHNLQQWFKLVSFFIQLRALIIDFFERYLFQTDLNDLKSQVTHEIEILLKKISNSRKSKLTAIANDLEAICHSFLSAIRGRNLETAEFIKDYLQEALKEQHNIWSRLEVEEKSHLASDSFAGCLLYLGTVRCNIQSNKINLMLARLNASNDLSSISALRQTIYDHLLKLEKQIPEKMQDCQAIDYSVWKPKVLFRMASDLDKQRMELGKSIMKENQKVKKMGQGKIGSNTGRIGGKRTNRFTLIAK